jgi:hypothetical protein
MELVRVVSDSGLYFREIILPGSSNEEQYKSLCSVLSVSLLKYGKEGIKCT